MKRSAAVSQTVAKERPDAIFIIRAWEMLRPGGIMAFIVPNSWLTVEGYEAFRRWILTHFDIMEVTNVWKIFSDVNYDATMLVARKRVTPIVATELTHAASDRSLNIKAIGRGKSEADKLKQIAEGTWTISHTTTHGFQCKQARHRFEVIFEPNIADELDRITARCKRLDQVADVTVGIQVYYDGPEGVYTPEGVSQHDQSSRRSARATWP